MTENLRFCDMPIHVCEKIPILPGLAVFPSNILKCPYCGELLRKESTMNFRQYRRSQIAELRPYVLNESMLNISVSSEDMRNGSPKIGDMIARNPKNHNDQWLVSEQYFKDNFEEIK